MEKTTQEKLKALAQLQKIDTNLDRIRQIRGGLPEEVRDLEDELEGLQTRIDRLNEDIEKHQKEISDRNFTIKESREQIKKYDAQLMNVKNNREYEAVSKEIELANLEIMTAERKITQFDEAIVSLKENVAEVIKRHEERKSDLDEKQKELSQIIAETEEKENRLLAESEKAAAEIEERLLTAYRKIRSNMRNGLAVVTMDRSACGGCFAIIPPQRGYEVRQKRKIIVCENCGRILVDAEYFGTEEPVAVAVA
jgi:uncharacterized protein